jgi:anti-anti-sigma regulatory factor
MPARTLVVPTLLVASTCEPFSRDVREALEDGCRTITLDFGPNAYTDRSGYLTLVALGREARAHGGQIVLRNPPRNVVQSLTSTGLAGAFAIEVRAGDLALV